MADVFVVGAATTRFGPHRATAADLAHEAVTAALADAGLPAADVPAAFVGSSGAGAPAGAGPLEVRLGLRRAGLTRGLEHVCPSGGAALHLAWRGVANGLYDAVVCVGVEALGNGADARPDAAVLRDRSDAARRYMAASGASVEQLALAAAKNHRHGASNPAAWENGPVTPQAVLDSEVVAWPLTELMVAPRGSGAAAVVLVADRGGRRLDRRAVAVRASVVATAAADEDPEARAVALAYARARIGADDLDCAEVHDESAAAELAAYEALQLVPAGQGPQLVETGFTELGGVLPVNASGGLLSLGELPGASGVAQISELVCQLRGEAAVRQVGGARTALAVSRGPGERPEERVASVTVLSTAGSGPL